MPTHHPGSVVITGASSGIGAATARLLLERGWQVIAAARRVEAMEPLARRGALVLPLDLCDSEARRRFADRVQQEVGVPDAMVNNAGFGEVGPLETTPLERARALFEVNVFGLMGLTQQLLPAMRERGKGRIVNVSSIAGRWVSPGSGWYGASKFAVEALSDGLRLEMTPFGIEVVVIEPGLIASDFADVAETSLQRDLDHPAYGPMMSKVRNAWQRGFCGASDPLTVAHTIELALTAARPRPRYACGHLSSTVHIRRILPTRVWDRLVRIRMA
jgi:short-subunit dehydrogenase